MDDKQAFWDEQAQRGSLSGTRDRYAKELEMQTIARYVSDGMRVLDVGCGDGETLEYLSLQAKLECVIGYDYSVEMINKAVNRPYCCPWAFDIRDIKNLKTSMTSPVDLIYTQRALINLDTWEEQRQAILDIISLLKPGGTYVMVECFMEGLQEINELRKMLALPEIKPPWHNRYLNYRDEVLPFFMEEDLLFDFVSFSGTYYFMSRVVNAYLAKQYGMEPAYDSTVNYLGKMLPPECVNMKGQVQSWIVRKKE